MPEAAGSLEAAGVPPRLAPLLSRRGVATTEEAQRFLHPAVDQLHDPHLLCGMDEAVARLEAARERGEKVAVVGDYDVDGVSSTALLVAVFGAVGLTVEPILPHRLRDGYGFQPVHAERAEAAGCRLIVTADCGTTSVDAVERAQRAGLDVIVTDHHLPGDAALPSGTLLINPRQTGCFYPFADLAAVGLAFKLGLALGRRCGRELPLEPLLRIASLGTIADLVPLLGENRVIAALGLEALGRTRSPGLLALFRKAGLSAPFTATDVGFRIGPRLNAAGRLNDAGHALDLLLTRDSRHAERLAEALETWNRERQEEEQKVVEEAREALAGRSPTPRFAVAWSAGWHQGVVGIAAGRLARELHRPTVLLAVEGGQATGSGRSVAGLDLHGFLDRWRDRMSRFGGHAQAVGLTVECERLEELRQAWEKAAEDWPEEALLRRFDYELDLGPRELGEELLAELARLEPHGQGNPQPLLKVGPLELAGPPRLFGRGHLAAQARGADGGSPRLLGWRWAERRDDLDGTFEVLGYLEKDAYQGGTVLRLVDARPVPPDSGAGSGARPSDPAAP